MNEGEGLLIAGYVVGAMVKGIVWDFPKFVAKGIFYDIPVAVYEAVQEETHKKGIKDDSRVIYYEELQERQRQAGREEKKIIREREEREEREIEEEEEKYEKAKMEKLNKNFTDEDLKDFNKIVSAIEEQLKLANECIEDKNRKLSKHQKKFSLISVEEQEKIQLAIDSVKQKLVTATINKHLNYLKEELWCIYEQFRYNTDIELSFDYTDMSDESTWKTITNTSHLKFSFLQKEETQYDTDEKRIMGDKSNDDFY